MNKLREHLHDLNVESIYFCAGSRNSSLLEYFCDFKIKMFFDERANSFKALGEAKITKKPVAICLTSGTAVSECLSAVIESFYSSEKLILITCDRPNRLYGTDAPQSIEQRHIFSTYIRSQYVGELANYTKREVSFPFQINLEIDEVNTQRPTSDISQINIHQFEQFLNSKKRPLFIFSEGSFDSQALLDLIDKNNHLTFVESLSHLKVEHLVHNVRNDKDLLALFENDDVDLVIRIGKTPITKLWRLFDLKFTPEVICIRSQTTGLAYGHIIYIEDHEMYDLITPAASHNHTRYDLLCVLNQFPRSEASVIYQLKSEIKKENAIVYLGNSMPIRYWEMLSNDNILSYANRGANGIDGQVATSIGIAENTSSKVYALLGDLTLLYDLNSLLMDLPSNLKIICLDNSGGRIFERVKVDPKMILEHAYDIKEITNFIENHENLEILTPCLEQSRDFWKLWDAL